MRILVTGASGLLGINLALEAAKNHTVFGTANTRPLHTRAFQPVQADLLAPGALERLLDTTQPDWVIHCAAEANLDACEADPQRAQRINAELPRQFARLVAKGGARADDSVRFVHISTDAVFDGQKGNYTEEDTPNPLSVYARTKRAAEVAVLEENPEAVVARVNLFGWSVTGKRSLGEFFVNNLSAGQRVMGFTDVFFCPLLANDLALVLLEMLEKKLSGLYHVVAGEAMSKYDFGVAIARQFDFDAGLITPTRVATAGLKAARSPNLTLSTHKLSTALGHPLPKLSTSIHRFWQLYQQGYPQQIRKMGD